LRDAARQKGKLFNSIDIETGKILEQYPWPGNVRELRNVIEYATFAFDEVELKPGHVIGLVQTEPPRKKQPDSSRTHRPIVLPVPPGGYPIKKYTDDIIREILSMHNGNQTAAARYLGMSLRGLTNRLEQQRVKPDENDDSGEGLI